MNWIYLPTTGADCQQVKEAVAGAYGLQPEDLERKTREQPIAFARQVAVYIAYRACNTSQADIALHFGGCDTSNISHAVNKIRKLHQPKRKPPESAFNDRRLALVELIDRLEEEIQAYAEK